MVDLKKICKTAVNLKIISFFHQYPATIDTSNNIATWLNQDHKEIVKALKGLVAQNILSVDQTGSTVAYAYTQDKEVVRLIDAFLKHKR